MKDLNNSFSVLSSACKFLSGLIWRCSRVTGRMKNLPFKLEFDGDPIFVKRRLLSYGLWRGGWSGKLWFSCFLTMSASLSQHLNGPPLFFALFKADDKTPGIYDAYLTTLCQQTCITEEPEDVLSRFHGSCFYRLVLKQSNLHIYLHRDCLELTAINTSFGLCCYRFCHLDWASHLQLFSRW